MSEPVTPSDDAPRGWAERVVDALHRRGRWFIPLILIVAFGVAVGARTMRVDNSLRVWFVEGDPALIAYDQYKEAFGNDETIVVAAVAPEGIYTPSALERVRAASKRFEAHPGVRRVTSVALGLHVSGSEGFLEVERLLGDGPITPADAAALRTKVAANPFYRGTVVGDSETMTLILVEPRTSPDFDRERAALIHDIRGIAHDELDRDGGGCHLGGIGVVYEGLNEASMRDTAIFVSLSYLIIFLGLWLLFRRWLWVGVGVLVVTAAIGATLGVAGLTGRDMNMVTAVLPSLLMTIGILDLVHLVDAYEEGAEANPGLSRRRLLAVSLGVVVVPCIFNTFTDVIGFASLASAKMSAVRDLGWLSSIGLLFLLMLILVVAVPTLARFGGRRSRLGRLAEGAHAPPAGEEVQGWMRAAVLRLYRIAAHRRPLVYGAAIALFAVSVAGIARIDVDTYTIGFLADDDPVRKDHDAIEAGFGDYIPMELRVEAPGEGGLKDPALLRRLDAMERVAEIDPRVGRVTGLPEVVKRVNQVWNDERPEAYAIPHDPDPKVERGVVAEELLTYGFDTEGRDHLDDLVTPDYRATHVTARTGMPTARGIQSIIENVSASSQAVMGNTAVVEPAGYLPLYVRIIQHITDTQVSSFAIAFATVALVLMILLRSWKLGLVSMFPNVLPAAMTLGFMGFVGIRLDVATVLIAAIAIGTSVNDTTHLMFRFKHELAADPEDPEGAVKRTLLAIGRPVVGSSLILMAGYSVLLFASVKSVYYFGLLSTATIGTALIAELLLTPALLLTLARRRMI